MTYMEGEHPTGTICVEVAYATPERQEIVSVELPVGTSVAEAIQRSGLRNRFPGLEIDPAGVGIFSRKVPLDQVLEDGDRVEIYRPLLVDPRDSRRERAGQPVARKKRS